ncbi:hypothetical protein C8R44DRAFT_772447 [Mycena epipterygia]|nr:hypothetical protein C8R44DRAFT_772447 [Mycena epipterygia]
MWWSVAGPCADRKGGAGAGIRWSKATGGMEWGGKCNVRPLTAEAVEEPTSHLRTTTAMRGRCVFEPPVEAALSGSGWVFRRTEVRSLRANFDFDFGVEVDLGAGNAQASQPPAIAVPLSRIGVPSPILFKCAYMEAQIVVVEQETGSDPFGSPVKPFPSPKIPGRDQPTPAPPLLNTGPPSDGTPNPIGSREH